MSLTGHCSLRCLLGSKTSGVQINLARIIIPQGDAHPQRVRGSQSAREKERDESLQVRVKEPLGTDSHRAISKNSSGCRLLIGHKKYFVLLCPIGEQFLLSSFSALSSVLENFRRALSPDPTDCPLGLRGWGMFSKVIIRGGFVAKQSEASSRLVPR